MGIVINAAQAIATLCIEFHFNTFFLTVFNKFLHCFHFIPQFSYSHLFVRCKHYVPTIVDLSAAPFSMTSSGFGRKLVIAEVGGPGNLFPNLHKEKEFDLQVALSLYLSPF